MGRGLSEAVAILSGMKLEAVISALAPAQRGLVTADQLEQAEVSEWDLRFARRRRRLEVFHPGVLRVVGTPTTWHQEVLAACLSTSGVASHRSAARLAGLRLPDRDIVEITVPRGRMPRLRGVITHRGSDLVTEETVESSGIPATTVARTLLDLGAVCSQGVVDRAVDDAISTRLTTLEELWRSLELVARKGRSGVGVLRTSLEWRYGVTESVLQARALRALREHGLPDPVIEHPVRLFGHDRFIDLAYPERLVAIELDGAATHCSPAALQYDNARQNDLVDAGWKVLRFTWADVTRHPKHVAARVKRMLELRTVA